MRLLANKNIQLASVSVLQDARHEVVSIMEESPKIPDEMVMQHAYAEARIVVTFNRNYGVLGLQRQSQA